MQTILIQTIINKTIKDKRMDIKITIKIIKIITPIKAINNTECKIITNSKTQEFNGIIMWIQTLFITSKFTQSNLLIVIMNI